MACSPRRVAGTPLKRHSDSAGSRSERVQEFNQSAILLIPVEHSLEDLFVIVQTELNTVTYCTT